MSGDARDFDDLFIAWRENSALDDEQLVHIARRASIYGNLVKYADLGIAVLIALAVFIALALRPAPATIAIGSVTAGALVWSSWKRHLVRQNASLRLLDAGSDFIAREIVRTQSELKRAELGLWFTPPATLLSGMLTYTIVHHGSLKGFGDVVLNALMSLPLGPAVIAAIMTLILYQIRLVGRLKAERLRLQGLDREYQEEARLDRIALG